MWRRSKLGLRLTPEQVSVIDDWMALRLSDDVVGNDKKLSGGTL